MKYPHNDLIYSYVLLLLHLTLKLLVLFNSGIATMEFSIFYIWEDLRFSWKSTLFEEIRGDLRKNFKFEEIWGGAATLTKRPEHSLKFVQK